MATAVILALSLGCSDSAAPPDIVPKPTKLAFLVAPVREEGSVPFSHAPQVAVLDQFGNTDTTATHPITLTLGADSSGVTLGAAVTVYAVAGVATFPDLSVTVPGSGYVLNAAAPGLTPVVSAAFAVGLTAAMVKAGSAYTCAATTAGFGYCWGWNAAGDLGDGTKDQHLAPEPVAGGLRFRQMDASSADFASHACGITVDSLAYCWGDNEAGQLGTGDSVSRQAPAPVVGGLRFLQINAGWVHTCGLAADGTAYCWGGGANLAPVAVGGTVQFVQLTRGDDHSCGLTAGNAAYCWGRNAWGQLGTGDTVSSAAPTPVSGGLAFAQLSAGDRYTCGVATDGAAYCWGQNGFGQLGDDTKSQTGRQPTPTLVSGSLHFAMVSAAYVSTCGVATDGAAYCWGANSSGNLGDGTTSQRLQPVPVTGGLSFAWISAGISHTCGVTTAHTIYCWGLNGDGELGDGTTTRSLTPEVIAP